MKKKFAGYINLKPLNGVIYPSSIQNILMKNFIETNLNGIFYLSPTEILQAKFSITLKTLISNETKSMFFTKPRYNKKMNDQLLSSDKFTTKEMYNKNKKNFKFLNVKFGEILIFSPLMLHGNTINKTKETRFSLNCRFKSLLSPYDVLVKSHRNIPNFYKPLNIKPLTKIGFNYIKKFENK